MTTGWPIVVNGRTWNESDFIGENYATSLPLFFQDVAQHYGQFYTATSSTSIPVGTGTRSLTVQTGKPFAIGQPVRIVRTADPVGVVMDGTITSFTSSTGAMTVLVAGTPTGSGSYSDWTISVLGGVGPTGATGAVGPAPTIATTSTATLPIQLGSTGAFAVAASTDLTLGSLVLISTQGDPSKFMFGTLTARSGATFTVNVLAISGAGTYSSWYLTLSGPQGIQGTQGVQGLTGATGPAVTLKTTSATSLTIGPGSFSFATAASLDLQTGQYLTLASAADSSNYMTGGITAIAGTAVTISVGTYDWGGVGTRADWNVGISGAKGAKGDTGAMGPYGTPPDATASVKGIVRLASSAVAIAGSDTERAVTPAALAAVLDARLDDQEDDGMTALPPLPEQGRRLDFAAGWAVNRRLFATAGATSAETTQPDGLIRRTYRRYPVAAVGRAAPFTRYGFAALPAFDNLLLDDTLLSPLVWGASGIAVSRASVSGPNGDTLAVVALLADSAAGAYGARTYACAVPDDSGSHFFQVQMKAGTSTHAMLRMALSGGTGIARSVAVQYSNGALSAGADTQFTLGGAEALPNGWYNIWGILPNNGTGNTALAVSVVPAGNAASATTTSYAQKAMLARSDIMLPFVGAAKAEPSTSIRADAGVLQRPTFSAGTLAVRGKSPVSSREGVLAQIDAGNDDTRIVLIRLADNSVRARFYDEGALVRDLNLGTWANNATSGTIVAWDYTSATGRLDGGADGVSTTDIGYDATVGHLRLGGAAVAGKEWGGSISRFDHRPVRIADASLQALVAA